MIVVDASALIAILLQEPEEPAIIAALSQVEDAVIGAPTALEFCVAAGRKLGSSGLSEAQIILDAGLVRVVDWPAGLLPFAQHAFATFGKGRHPASLNFGDCMVYALAKSRNSGLLYKGNDFSKTDIRSVL